MSLSSSHQGKGLTHLCAGRDLPGPAERTGWASITDVCISSLLVHLTSVLLHVFESALPACVWRECAEQLPLVPKYPLICECVPTPTPFHCSGIRAQRGEELGTERYYYLLSGICCLWGISSTFHVITPSKAQTVSNLSWSRSGSHVTDAFSRVKIITSGASQGGTAAQAWCTVFRYSLANFKIHLPFWDSHRTIFLHIYLTLATARVKDPGLRSNRAFFNLV